VIDPEGPALVFLCRRVLAAHWRALHILQMTSHLSRCRGMHLLVRAPQAAWSRLARPQPFHLKTMQLQ
jgi:hypothetical protein